MDTRPLLRNKTYQLLLCFTSLMLINKHLLAEQIVFMMVNLWVSYGLETIRLASIIDDRHKDNRFGLRIKLIK